MKLLIPLVYKTMAINFSYIVIQSATIHNLLLSIALFFEENEILMSKSFQLNVYYDSSIMKATKMLIINT